MFWSARQIEGGTLKALKLKEKDRLAIVYETVYNAGPVTIIRKGKMDGCISASFHKMANLLFKVREAAESQTSRCEEKVASRTSSMFL